MAKDKSTDKANSAENKWKPPKYQWKAPSDFTPFFLEVKFKTEKDGLLGGTIVATRYKGKYDPKDEKKRKWDLATYDVPTLIAIQARFAAATFHASGKPNKKGESARLAPNTTYKLLLRVGKRKADDTLTCSIKQGWKAVKKGEKVKAVEMDKKETEYRRIRRAAKHLPAAFRSTIAPPKGVRMKKKGGGDEE
jgi:hypothetical protein